jgi:hypothetical protein
LCRKNNECVGNDFLSLHNFLAKGFNISYPVTIHPQNKQVSEMAIRAMEV